MNSPTPTPVRNPSHRWSYRRAGSPPGGHRSSDAFPRLAREDRNGYGTGGHRDDHGRLPPAPQATVRWSEERRQGLGVAAGGLAREAVGALPGFEACEELEALLDLVAVMDRTVAQVIDRLIVLQSEGSVEVATGVGVELWLAQVARRTGSDVRMLCLAADLLPLLPVVRGAFARGHLSWSQVRAILLEVRTLPADLLDDADATVGDWLQISPAPDPDTVTRGLGRLRWQFDTDRSDRQLRSQEARSNFVGLQARLDDSGGRGWFDYDGPTFALVQAALDAGSTAPASRGGFDDPGDRAGQAATLGGARAQRLAGWAEQHLDQLAIATGRAALLTDPDDGPDVGSRADRPAAPVGQSPTAEPIGRLPAGTRIGALPGLLLRVPLETILGGGLPGELLTSLTGGKLRVSARTARRLVRRGVDLRAIVVDETGAVVGVGAATRQPPGWLADAVLACNATCTAPGCRAPARVGQLDHARPVAARDGGPPGPTDVANLQPLCARHNRTKEAAGWKATGTADGSRTWRHPRSGLAQTALPDHWPPTLPDPPANRSDGRPPGSGPPRPDSATTGTCGSDPPTVADRYDRNVDPDVPF